jgi:glycerol kinase
MEESYIISLDQGTTSSRAVLFDSGGAILGIEQQEFRQHFPHPGWVEHDADEIWRSQWDVFSALIGKQGIEPAQVAGIGITNQRETTVVWDKRTGEPVCNAIVWQDRRTAEICENLKQAGMEAMIRDKTGLVIDAYFSATKIQWILENIPGAREAAGAGRLLFGTIDTWLTWKLTSGAVHATDYSNASRTMVFNIETLQWDEELLKVMDIPRTMMPEVRDSAGDFGYVDIDNLNIPILGVAGDQQAALFGQACFEDGSAKNTYGTGCFLLMNTGGNRISSDNGLLTTIAWSLNGQVCYALEGSVFVAGAAIQWLRDGLGIIDSAGDSEVLARQASPGSTVYVVPAFTGLGAPYWDMYARGAILGLTRDSGPAEICRATLDSLAYQVRDVLDAMQADSGLELSSLRVDGGACVNNYLLQFQADILDVDIVRPTVIESTARGAAYLAGLASGLWDLASLSGMQEIDRTFKPSMSATERDKCYAGWKKAVGRAGNWLG